MEKIDFKSAESKNDNYAAAVREAEGVYGEKLSDKMFNLGAAIHTKTIKTQFPIDAKAWAAWMRKMDFVERHDRVIFGMAEPKAWWIDKVFDKFHKDLARHFDRRVYYAMNGQIIDLALYDIKPWASLSQDEKKEVDAVFSEVKANVRDFMNKAKILKGAQ